MSHDFDGHEPDTSRDAGGRWLAGHSGNPSGSPVVVGSITVELRRQLEHVDGDGRRCTLASRDACSNSPKAATFVPSAR